MPGYSQVSWLLGHDAEDGSVSSWLFLHLTDSERIRWAIPPSLFSQDIPYFFSSNSVPSCETPMVLVQDGDVSLSNPLVPMETYPCWSPWSLCTQKPSQWKIATEVGWPSQAEISGPVVYLKWPFFSMRAFALILYLVLSSLTVVTWRYALFWRGNRVGSEFGEEERRRQTYKECWKRKLWLGCIVWEYNTEGGEIRWVMSCTVSDQLSQGLRRGCCQHCRSTGQSVQECWWDLLLERELWITLLLQGGGPTARSHREVFRVSRAHVENTV